MTPPSQLRILMTADAVGGVWFYASELARALCAGGHQVLLVILGPEPAPNLLSRLLHLRNLQLKITNLQLEWLDPQGTDIVRAQRSLLRLAEEFHPDLVHLNSFREANFDWPAPVLVVAHSCVQTWWHACRGCFPDEWRWNRYAENVAAGLCAADVWVAPTASFAAQITATYQPARPSTVIRNGVTVRRTKTRTKQPFILAAGRVWDEAKNLIALTTVASELSWPVRIAGPRQSPDGTSTSIAAENVTYLGEISRDDLLEEMSRAAVFAAPALYEPFGLTVLEAAAHGCALVLSDLSGFRELWGDAALFVNPKHPTELKDAVRTVCGDEELRTRLQNAARARASLHSLPAMVMAYRQLYDAMTASVSAARDHSIRELLA
jgi:glycosyltransferase involved in cell wall biosynthesis